MNISFHTVNRYDLKVDHPREEKNLPLYCVPLIQFIRKLVKAVLLQHHSNAKHTKKNISQLWNQLNILYIDKRSLQYVSLLRFLQLFLSNNGIIDKAFDIYLSELGQEQSYSIHHSMIHLFGTTVQMECHSRSFRSQWNC